SLYLADEVILTGTAAEVTPVREIDGRVIGNGTPGDVTRALQGAFDDAIHGRRHAEWLTAFGAPARQKTAEAA
ncbi:MAG: branched-chain amino acid aminotransferase, partial [Myxococcota bacterium]